MTGAGENADPSVQIAHRIETLLEITELSIFVMEPILIGRIALVYDPGLTGEARCRHDDDLCACPKSRRQGRGEPDRRSVSHGPSVVVY